MIEQLWLIGIGTGDPSHLTLQGVEALREAAVILLPLKGDEKEDLAALRHEIIKASGSTARIVSFDYPTRDPPCPIRNVSPPGMMKLRGAGSLHWRVSRPKAPSRCWSGVIPLSMTARSGSPGGFRRSRTSAWCRGLPPFRP